MLYHITVQFLERPNKATLDYFKMKPSPTLSGELSSAIEKRQLDENNRNSTYRTCAVNRERD